MAKRVNPDGTRRPKVRLRTPERVELREWKKHHTIPFRNAHTAQGRVRKGSGFGFINPFEGMRFRGRNRASHEGMLGRLFGGGKHGGETE